MARGRCKHRSRAIYRQYYGDISIAELFKLDKVLINKGGVRAEEAIDWENMSKDHEIAILRYLQDEYGCIEVFLVEVPRLQFYNIHYTYYALTTQPNIPRHAYLIVSLRSLVDDLVKYNGIRYAKSLIETADFMHHIYISNLRDIILICYLDTADGGGKKIILAHKDNSDMAVFTASRKRVIIIR